MGRWGAVAPEHDSEKWNALLGIILGLDPRALLVLFGSEHLILGAGWFRAL
jgi:hypothetical protein